MNSKNQKDYEISTDNIFANLGLEDSEELLTRARLMHELGLLIKSSKLSQKQIAQKLGISQPKVSMLISGKFNEFSTEKLMHYLSLIGCYVEISIQKPRTRGLFSRRGHIAVV
ncbi:MAG TPA: helix-turn-helix transcriptional regulator [Rhabdochlamydiaceae bacterium]|nr:helix-turn-helix transcriptional regulator [Rhabdochlamydiaceae bacterium]